MLSRSRPHTRSLAGSDSLIDHEPRNNAPSNASLRHNTEWRSRTASIDPLHRTGAWLVLGRQRSRCSIAIVWSRASKSVRVINRLGSICSRYGWRTTFVVPFVGGQRVAARQMSALRVGSLRLITIGRKGSRCRLGAGLSVSPGARLDLGDGLYIGARCTVEISVSPPGCVSIGSRTWISHDTHLASRGRITIGEEVLIGEFVSIRDTTHAWRNATEPVRSQNDIIGEITIEDDVWIGRGSLILGRPGGITIGRGAVVAANSVVSKSVPAGALVGGAPARILGNRADEPSRLAVRDEHERSSHDEPSQDELPWKG